jgi:hypothetical protein
MVEERRDQVLVHSCSRAGLQLKADVSLYEGLAYCTCFIGRQAIHNKILKYAICDTNISN